jgi:RNA polymerase sigma factor (sigma-70 family)
MRRRLVSYFDRRNCDNADDLADETLNRVMRRLNEEGYLRDSPPARYCYIVAKFVFLEELRRPRNSDAGTERLESLPQPAECHVPGSISEAGDRESLLDCLDACLRKLDPPDRELILEYYRGEQRAKIESRRSIALKMGLSMNAISIRACRIRSKLESCMRNCSRNS